MEPRSQRYLGCS